MTHKRSFAFAAGVSLIVLAACGGGGGGGIANVVPQFGPAFAAAFNAADTGAPVEPGNITFLGVTGPNLTAAPVDL